MIFFTADTHFCHRRVIEYNRRPFQTPDEMDRQFIQNWNGKITPEDDVYILGDFTLKGPSMANELLSCLHGRKHLIRGNHDQFAGRASFRRDQLVWIKDYFELNSQGQFFILSHYPLASWNGMRRGSFQLHGHMHGKRFYNEAHRVFGVRQLDVGVDAWNMAPVSLEELAAFWEEEHRPDSYWKGVKPSDIRLELTCSCVPEQYDAFDPEGRQVGFLHLRSGEFKVECPDCGGELVYSAWTAGWGAFEPDERNAFLEKAKRAIAEYWHRQSKD